MFPLTLKSISILDCTDLVVLFRLLDSNEMSMVPSPASLTAVLIILSSCGVNLLATVPVFLFLLITYPLDF